MTDYLNEELCDWARLAGAVVVKTTNPYEVARMHLPKGVAVIYSKKNRDISFSNPLAEEVYDAFIGKHPFPPDLLIAEPDTEGTKPTARRANSKSLRETLTVRDGEACFFCGDPMTQSDPATLEHLVSLSAGGSYHLSNLCLAHKECNGLAGERPVVEKVRLRSELHKKKGNPL